MSPQSILLLALATIAGCNSSSTPSTSDFSSANDFSTTNDLVSTNDGGSASDGATVDENSAADFAGDPCTASGGTVSMSLCCASAGDFPDTCLIGACSCAPGSSHMVKLCQCPMGMCFDGTKCKTGTPL